MRALREALRDGRLIEGLLALYILWAIARVAVFVHANGYLPQPFFYQPADTFADWFNPAHWARNRGTYDTWGSLYPPISFVLLRLLGVDSCYDSSGIDPSAGLAARSCDWVGVTSIFGFWILDVVMVFLCFRRIDRSRSVARTIAVGLGFPMLNALERGNLVLVSFACMVLAFGPLLRSSRLKALAAGCAVNFKVYLLAAIVPLVIKRRWSWVELALVLVVVVYIATFALLGRGSLYDLANNIAAFSDLKPATPLDIWMTGSYNPAIALLKNDDFPAVLFLGSQWRDGLLLGLPLLVHGAQLTIIAALAIAALRPEAVPSYRLVNLGVLLAEISSEAGAYSIVYHAFFVMMEPWRGLGRKFAIVVCYLIALPIEIPIQDVAPVTRFSYIADADIIVQYYVGLTPFLRPLTTILIAVALALVTMREVWLDVRLQGWAERWRMRYDAPLLPWVRRPTPGKYLALESEEHRQE